jgi:dihydropteroate synthase
MPTPPLFRFGKRELDLSVPQVMGILNLTPDSFSDGGELLRGGKPMLDLVLHRAEAMVQAGATLLDIGGESTRPGAAPITESEELDRVAPVLEALAARFDVVLSADTSSAEVIKGCAQLGAGLINDVRALTRPGALQAAAASGLPVCLMHMKGEPGTMQANPTYEDVVGEVIAYLRERKTACVEAGIGAERLLVDPGFGFGKTLTHNLELLNAITRFSALECPVLIGLSRKRMLGTLTGKPEKERVAAGVAAAVVAVMQGASIVRTHDVAETVDALQVCRHLLQLAAIAPK